MNKKRTDDESREYEAVIREVMLDLSEQAARTTSRLAEKYGHPPEVDAVLHGISDLLFDGVRRFSKNYADADTKMRRISKFLVQAIKNNPSGIGVNEEGYPDVKLKVEQAS